MIIKRVHYSGKPIEINPASYRSISHGLGKPAGLWYSCEGYEADWGWKEWCTQDDFKTDDLEYSVCLNVADLNILHLPTDSHIRQFRRNYCKPMGTYDQDSNIIDWDKVRSEYNGIEIHPYSYNLRFKEDWYYGWDCASGVIWNIEYLKVV